MATYYVATTGNNSDPGTIGSPFLTIAKGISVLVAGDTLYIRSGTYAESINSNSQTIPVGTSWSNAPLISAYQSEAVTLRNVGLVASYIKYVIFQNLIIDSQQAEHEVVSIGYGTNHIRFVGCEIKNSEGQGIGNYEQNDGFNEFINCNIHHNGTTSGKDHGIYIGSSNNLIEGCQIHHNAAYGIHNYNGYPGQTSNNNVFRNNRVYANGVLGITVNNVYGIIVGYGSGSVAYNNLVYSNTGGGIFIASASNVKAVNNTIYGNNGGYALEVSGSGSTVKNNIIYGNEYNEISDRGTGTVLTPNLFTNPSFVNVA